MSTLRTFPHPIRRHSFSQRMGGPFLPISSFAISAITVAVFASPVRRVRHLTRLLQLLFAHGARLRPTGRSSLQGRGGSCNDKADHKCVSRESPIVQRGGKLGQIHESNPETVSRRRFDQCEITICFVSLSAGRMGGPTDLESGVRRLSSSPHLLHQVLLSLSVPARPPAAFLR